ncbi:MAG: glycosyltransferase [Candidatus Omnitrophota bacterium]|nr:glycosyltransferase [Candidatus Omnitrophota bacterium]
MFLIDSYIRDRLVRKVRAKKEKIARLGTPYTENPKVSAVVTSYNHRANIKPILEAYRAADLEELIVCEDGSLDGSRDEWLKHLLRPNDFLIVSNELNELRIYNRAISLARGEIVIVNQDDDIPPQDASWIRDAVRLFDKYPRLAILGALEGAQQPIFTLDNYYRVKSLAERLGQAKFRIPRKEIQHRDPELGVGFMFIDVVNNGPLIFRRQAYLELGGLDTSRSKAGESMMFMDYDLCYRAWLAGWQVGLYEHAPFVTNAGQRASVLFAHGDRKKRGKETREYLNQAYSHVYEDVGSRARRLNEEFLTLADHKETVNS